MINLVLHLPEEELLSGLVHFRWMYPYERFIKKLKDYVKNRAQSEGSIFEGYIIDESLLFSSMYLEGVETKFNRPNRNEEGNSKSQLSIFNS